MENVREAAEGYTKAPAGSKHSKLSLHDYGSKGQCLPFDTAQMQHGIHWANTLISITLPSEEFPCDKNY